MRRQAHHPLIQEPLQHNLTLPLQLVRSLWAGIPRMLSLLRTLHPMPHLFNQIPMEEVLDLTHRPTECFLSTLLRHPEKIPRPVKVQRCRSKPPHQ